MPSPSESNHTFVPIFPLIAPARLLLTYTSIQHHAAVSAMHSAAQAQRYRNLLCSTVYCEGMRAESVSHVTDNLAE
jgi:hypothetical protein